MYEFVTKDGSKISASKGENTFSVGDLQNIYTPRLVRYLFAGARPATAFEIPFESEDIFQRYNKFDEIEKSYFSVEDHEENESQHLKRVYELSCISVPDQQPSRVDFKHAAIVAQAIPRDRWDSTGINKLVDSGHLPEDPSEYEIESALQRLERGFSWARNYGPEKYRFIMESDYVFSDSERAAAEDLVSRIKSSTDSSPDAVDELVFDVKDSSALGTGEFFSAMYKKILGKDHGPRLSTLISAMEPEKLEEVLLD
jgi:Lysyl-tRNA synthetase (class I)